MKLTMVLACCLLALGSLASAEEVKPTTSELTDETSSDVHQVADQDADEWYGRGYYGRRYLYNPYGYNAKSYDDGHGYGHWRGRRSAPSAAEEDQKADASSYGYYRSSYYRPYPYYNRHYYPSSSYSYRYY